MFRKINKAIGESGYLYDGTVFYDDGTFKRVEVHSKDTHVRINDPTKTRFEVHDFNSKIGWRLITEEHFDLLKREWDYLRDSRGFVFVESNGH